MGPGMAWDDLRLLMEEVKFEKGDDQKKVDTMVKRVIQMFMEAGCTGSDESDVTVAPESGWFSSDFLKNAKNRYFCESIRSPMLTRPHLPVMSMISW
jgi:hypothetical protein